MHTKDSQNLSIHWLISHFRWLWVAVMLAIVILQQPPATAGPAWQFFVPASGLIVNFLVLIMLLLGWYPQWVAGVVTFFDTLLAIAVVWMLGGHTAPALPILLFPVITGVIAFTPETGLLLVAVPIALAYAIFLISGNHLQPESLLKAGTDLIAIFGTGVLTGYLSQKQVQAQTQHAHAEIKSLRVEAERAKAIYEMANTLSSTLNYHNVLNAMVELAQLALAEADSNAEETAASAVGMVLLFEEDDVLGKLRLVSGRNIPRHDEGKQVSAKEGILAQIVYKAEAIVGNNVQHDPVLKNFIALQNCDSVVGAPLRAGFDMYGVVLFAHPQKNMYTQSHAALLTTFCNQAIIPLQNAQLYADLEREQRKLLEKEAQARRELARNLHDGPTQAISALAMRLNFIQLLLKKEGLTEKALDELHKMEEIALRATQEIRTMLFTLRPIVLETQGLAAALKQYSNRLQELHGLDIDLDIQNYAGQLNTDEEGVVFTIIEEAVGNARKYANQGTIEIHLAAQKDRVVAAVVDHGPGFDVEAVKATYDQRGSLGLLNMEERAQMVGGICQIQSVKGKGTTVRIEVPING